MRDVRGLVPLLDNPQQLTRKILRDLPEHFRVMFVKRYSQREDERRRCGGSGVVGCAGTTHISNLQLTNPVSLHSRQAARSYPA